MTPTNVPVLAAIVASASLALAAPAPAQYAPQSPMGGYQVEVGPRPYYLVNDMDEGPLKSKLESCKDKPKSINRFVIGHRGGGTMQFPEETKQDALAGARMGAGILECDVAFTSDLGLVCRHSFCDLHTTTDILKKPDLAKKCSTPFEPAAGGKDAKVECCTSDITLAEFKSLCGKMDGYSANATEPEDYQGPPPEWRTTLYGTCGSVFGLEDWIDFVKDLPGDRDYSPELKTPTSSTPIPFKGSNGKQFTLDDFRRKFIQTFKDKGVPAKKVWPQSFVPDDVFYWLKEFPSFGKQAILLDEGPDTPDGYAKSLKSLSEWAKKGVKIVAPDTNGLVALGGPNNDTIVASSYARKAKELGLDIITWTLERSGPLGKGGGGDGNGGGGSYYAPIKSIINNDGDEYNLLDALVNKVGIRAVFSDWAATIVYYADCFGLKGPQPNV